MKRLLTIVSFIVFAAGVASAQEGLFVEDLFEGKVVASKQMKRTFISGSKLHPYGLDTYKSISFQVGETLYGAVERLVLNDAEGVEDKTTEYDGDHLTYAIICLPKTNTGLNRFLCFQAKPDEKNWDVTVVYLRGTATVEDLDKMFNKRNIQK